MVRRTRSFNRTVSCFVMAVLVTALIPFAPAMASPVAANATRPPDTTVESQATMSRIEGENRLETAVSISQSGWTEAETVVIATMRDFPDALVAGPLAHALGAPILPTETQTLPQATADEITRLGATHAVIMGGTSAVAAAVEDQLRAAGITRIERVAGPTRYETALAAAERIASLTDEIPGVVIATGLKFPDALAISGWSGWAGMPIVLSDESGLRQGAVDFMENEEVWQTLIVGGEAAVPVAVEGQAPNPLRVGGEERYDTARLLAEYAYAHGFSYSKLFVTTGQDFPDALFVGPLASEWQSPVILTEPTTLTASADEFINAHCSAIDDVIILGGTSAVSAEVSKGIQKASATEYLAPELVENVSQELETALDTITPEFTFEFDSTSVDLASVQTSDILVAEPSDAAPEGYLRRVVNVTDDGTTVSIETTEATLADVIIKGSLDVTAVVPPQPGDIDESFAVGDVTPVDSTHVDVEFDRLATSASRVDPEASLGSFGAAIDVDLMSLAGKEVRMSGSINISGSFALNAYWGRTRWVSGRWRGVWPFRWWEGGHWAHGLNQVKAVVYLSQTFDMYVESELDVNINKEFPISSLKRDLPGVTIWIGVVPIYIRNVVTPIVGIRGSLREDWALWVREMASTSLGVRWTYSGGWSPIKTWSSSFAAGMSAQEATVRVSLGAALDMLIYGIAGPYFQPALFAEFNSNVSHNPWWTLDAGLSAKFGGAIDVFGKRAAFGWTYDLQRWRLLQAPGAYPSMREEPDLESGAPTEADPTFMSPEVSSPLKLDPSTVDPEDFTIPGLTVTEAKLRPDGRTVRLTTSETTPGQDYSVGVGARSIQEQAATARVIECSDTFVGYWPVTMDYAAGRAADTIEVVFDSYSSLDDGTVAAADFSVAGLTVTDAQVQPDGQTVVLTTSAQAPGVPYVVECAKGAVGDGFFTSVDTTSSATGYASYAIANTSIAAIRSVFQIREVSPTIAYAVGMEGHVEKTTNGGATWTRLAGRQSWNSYDIAFPDSSNPNLAAASSYGGFLNRTTNGGATNWANLNLSGPPTSLSHVDGLDFAGDTGYGVAVDGGNLVYSDDFGATWQNHAQDGTFSSSGIRFADSQRGYIVGSTRVQRTDDGGATWTETPATGAPANLTFPGISPVDRDTLVVVGIGGTIIRTDDGGQTWETCTSGTSFNLSEVDWADGNVVFAGGQNGVLLVSRDAGRTWDVLRANSAGNAYVGAIWARDALNVWTAGLNAAAWKITGS